MQDSEIRPNEVSRRGGSASLGDHCFNSAKAISTSAEGGVIEDCGHWSSKKGRILIADELSKFWS